MNINNANDALSKSLSFFSKKEYSNAQKTLEQASVSYPNNAQIWSNLGYLAFLQGLYREGEEWSRRAIISDKMFPPGYAHQALCLNALNRPEEAEKILLSAINLGINDAQIFTNLGLVYQTKHQTQGAIQYFNQALALKPNQAEAMTNLASSYLKIGNTDRALEIYRSTLAHQSNDATGEHDHTKFAALSNYLLCLQYMPNIGSLKLKTDAVEHLNNIIPAHNITSPKTKNRNQQISHNDKLRIGFVSADFRSHPISWFLLETFRKLSKLTDCYCYSNSATKDEFTDEFINSSVSFRKILGVSDTNVLKIIQGDNIDVLIDLSGHTAGNRLSLFQHKPAIRQYSWFGYAATTGLTEFDGVLLGQDLITPATSNFFIEHVKALDALHFSYTPPDYAPAISPCPFEHKHCITFGSFNNTSKLNINVLRTWAKILLKIKNSRLIIKWQSFADKSICKSYLHTMIALGIDEHRLEFRGPTSHLQHLQDYADIDISLDPFPFCGALTTCESLLMGVPVVTLAMERPLSRQSLAINRSFGLDHLCVETPKDYIEASVKLAGSSDQLIELRRNLRQDLLKTSEVNSAKQATALHTLFTKEITLNKNKITDVKTTESKRTTESI